MLLRSKAAPATNISGRQHSYRLSERYFKGRQYLSGFLGKSRVIAFEGEADRYGNPTWDIFVGEPEARDGTPAPRQSPLER